MEDLYLLLGVRPTATQAEILEAFNEKKTEQQIIMKSAAGTALEEKAAAKLQLLFQAKRILTDSDARAAYDALPEDLQVLVKNYNVLVEAEEAYNKLAATGIADINAETTQKDGKFLNKGRLVIMKNGKLYTPSGVLIMELK